MSDTRTDEVERAYQAWQQACRRGTPNRLRLFKAYLDAKESADAAVE